MTNTAWQNQLDEDVLVAVMGGTVDQAWDPTADTSVARKVSIIPRYLEAWPFPGRRSYVPIVGADSRALGMDDRLKLRVAIQSSLARKVLVTHGTYGMTESAMFMELNDPDLDKTIVFTGAWYPLDIYRSDGGFNLGYAMAKLAVLPSGNWVTLNGETFKQSEVMKVYAEARFKSARVGAGLGSYEGLHVYIMGGSAEFTSDRTGSDRLVPRRQTQIPEYLQDRVRINRQLKYSAISFEHSMNITETDRERFVHDILSSPYQKGIAVHGTVTMADTVEYARDRVGADFDKTIVVTGSSVPINDELSDATLNLGFGVGMSEILPPGIYIAMHGRILEPDEMRAFVQTGFYPDQLGATNTTSLQTPSLGLEP